VEEEGGRGMALEATKTLDAVLGVDVDVLEVRKRARDVFSRKRGARESDDGKKGEGRDPHERTGFEKSNEKGKER